jgi:hypothetical protein
VLEAALVLKELHVGAVDKDTAGSLLLEVFLAAERGKAPVLANDDLLAARELVLRAAEGLEGGGAVYKSVSSVYY